MSQQNQKLNGSNWRRAVIKVGSALVAPQGRGLSTKFSLDIASFITKSRQQGKEMILVTSGAVAAGLTSQHKKFSKQQLSIAEKQAIAAIGQPLLMAHWSKFFDFPCAQLLLTYQGIYERQRFVNAKNTLLNLLERNVLPVVNENDTVIIDELKVGDNDNLAAHVAVLADADLLIICSDVDGLFSGDPRQDTEASLVHTIEHINEDVYKLAGDTKNPTATGGMRTKIEAAEKATARGIDTIILNGTKRKYLEGLLDGNVHGTVFLKKDIPMNAKKHWMLHALPSSGSLYVDNGAARAVREKGASLLPSGVVKVKGHFTRGDAVTIVHESADNPQTIAKGLSQYDSTDLAKIIGKKSTDIESILGYSYTDVVIHRDDLVLLR